MPRWKVRGYIVQIYATDHPPLHAHVFKDGRLVALYDFENRCFMRVDERHRGRIAAALRKLGLT